MCAACAYGIQESISSGARTVDVISGNNIEEASIENYSVTSSSTYIGGSSSPYTTVSVPLNFPSGISQSTATAGGVAPPNSSSRIYPHVFEWSHEKRIMP